MIVGRHGGREAAMSDGSPRTDEDEFPDRDPFDDAGEGSFPEKDESIVVPDGPIRTGPDVGPVLEGDDGETRPPGLTQVKRPGRGRRRVVGVLALLLGSIGSALSLVAAFSSVAVGFDAGDTADRLMAPIESTVDRLDVRVDQIDDLMVPFGATTEDRAELAARVDGMVDLTTAASQAFTTIEDHPVYGRLPVNIDELGESLAAFDEGATTIEAELDSAGPSGLTAQNAEVMAERVNSMQGSFSTVQDQVEAADSSLTSWTRLGSFSGFVVSFWSLWAQTWLVRRGWRGLRGLDP
jgi:hypothetical protein